MLLCILFAEILPSVAATPPRVALAITVIVAANAGIRVGVTAVRVRFAALLSANLALVLAASPLVTGERDFQLGAAPFFAVLHADRVPLRLVSNLQG